MSKHLMYVVAVALSVAVAACATTYEPRGVTGEYADRQRDADTALQRATVALNRMDYATALRELQPLVRQGNALAQTNLGDMYTEGWGVVKDDTEAVRLYRQAATQGHALAQNNLGYMYAKGLGVAKDDAEAVRLYRQAADPG